MKSVKKLMSIALCVIMFVSALPMVDVSAADTVNSGTYGDNLAWKLDSEGALTISGSGKVVYDISKMIDGEGYLSAYYEAENDLIYGLPDVDDAMTLVIGSKVESFDVTIDMSKYGLESETAEFGLTGWFPNLTTISLDGTSKYFTVSDNVLFNKSCSQLIGYPRGKANTKYTIPDSVISIGGFAFSGCSNLTSITIPSSVTSIGSGAFSDCSSLTSLTIPDGVTSIGYDTFANCSSLTSITIPNSVTSISEDAFSGCNDLIIYGNIGSAAETYANKKGINFCTCPHDESSHISTNEIPATCTANGYTAGVYCNECKIWIEGHKTIAQIDHIDENGDKKCDVCGNSATTILESGTCGDNLVWTLDSEGILTISGSGEMKAYANVGEYVSYTPPWSSKDELIKTVVIEEGVASIADGAFASSEGMEGLSDDYPYLTSVKIPDSVTSIGNYAFYYCDSLTSITIPDSVTSIGGCAFEGCTGLTSITIPNSVTSIGSYVFSGCSGLTSVTIPNSVTSIGEGAFRSCSGLTNITIGSGLKNIGSSAFSGCSGLTSVTISDSVTSIGESAFSGCIKLTSVTIPNSVTSIGSYAFYGCSGLTSVTLSDGVTTIGDHAFHDCSKMTHITIPSSVTSIGNDTFKNCPNLVILGYGGTEAETHAKNRNITFIDLDTHVHSYTEQVTKATTCTEDGSSLFTCLCGDNYTKTNPATGHKEVYYELPISATCTTDGMTAGKMCFRCGEITQEPTVIKATGHTEVVDKAVDATCTETGLSEGKHCSVCNTVIVAQTEVPAKGHTEVVDKAVDATCTETGLTEGKHCSVCNTVIVAQTEVAAKGHTEVTDEAVAATCTETGLTEGKHCSVCNTVTVAQTEVPAKGHTEVTDEAVDATCTETGLTEGKHCSVCGEIFVAQTEIPATGHKEVYYELPISATCTTDGMTAGKMCFRCGEITQEPTVIKATGHTEVTDKAVAATCTETGLTEGKHCSVCNTVTVAQTEVPAKGHTEVTDEAVAATCTETGLTEGKHCSVCNTVIVAQIEVAAKGHTEVVDKAVDATCTETGLTEGKHCSVCNTVIVAQTEVAAKGHTEVTDEAVAATCTETGLTEGKHCSVCNTVIVAQTEVSAKGHTEVTDEAVAATCTETGLTEGKHCLVCNTVIVAQTEVPAKGHTYKTTTTKATLSKDGSTVTKCTVCGVQTSTAIAKISSVSLSKTSLTYTGKAQKPTVTVKDSKGKTLKQGTDYTVEYSKGCKNVGQYTVTVKFKGNYDGKKTLTFKIVPKGTSISSLSAGSKRFTVKWKKQSTQTSGYEIRYSTSSKMKNAKTVTVSKNSTTSKTIKNLKASKTYYVQIRTFKTVKINGKNTTLYSSWSTTAKVKTKK